MTAPARTASVDRKTSETSISLTLSLDGEGEAKVHTGIPFLDHMLTCLPGMVSLTWRYELKETSRWTTITPWRMWDWLWVRP